jgi:uncharacterized membrane protein
MTPNAGATGGVQRLERVVGIVLRAGVTISSICLAAGLAWTLARGADSSAKLLLQIGIIVLLSTPVARVIVSIGEYIVERDWPFVTLTAIVLLELLASAVAALVFNKKL